MQPRSFAVDPRYFQVIFQVIFLSYGIFFLEWNSDWLHYAISIGSCLLLNYFIESIKQLRFLPLRGRSGWGCWGFSVLISAMSLCLLLKTNHWYISLLAAFLTRSPAHVRKACVLSATAPQLASLTSSVTFIPRRSPVTVASVRIA
jgi:hypothetical protein